MDRDGVINRPPIHRYITTWKEFRFIPGVLKALRTLASHGWTVVVVSNQSGVGRGHLKRSQLGRITRRMKQAVRQSGGKIQSVYYCIHRSEAGCACRKPKIGMLKKAAKKSSLDLTRSFVIGDQETDILMGRSAGCQTILVLSGKHRRIDVKGWSVRPGRIAKDLGEATRWILDRNPAR